jgi:hypothetical protein
VIVSDIPAIFPEFRGKRFSLLWRGGRDGFRADAFHGRCDGHANTLTMILDAGGNIFGGFTPVAWDSKSCNKADDSLRSFLFTLKNPYNLAARRFALKAEKKSEAIFCLSGCGPHFNDLVISNNCHAQPDSSTFRFGEAYTNDTGLTGSKLLTGSRNFKVKEIEVFEITN